MYGAESTRLIMKPAIPAALVSFVVILIQKRVKT